MSVRKLHCGRSFLCFILSGLVLIHFWFYLKFFSLTSAKSSRRLLEKTSDNQNHQQAEENVLNQSMRLYSAFIDEKYTADSYESAEYHTVIHKKLIVIAWHKEGLINESFKCCILFGSENIITSNQEKSNQCCYGRGKLRARRIECRLDENITEPVRISLAKWNLTCPKDKQYYIQPTILEPVLKKNQWAVCNKYLYGSGPNAKLLVQWFEIHRFLGVDKFTIHHETTINPETKKVFDFYQEEGIAEVLHIDAPYKETIERQHEHPRSELFSDEQVGLWDCRERNKYYEFSGDIDSDEFILPKVIKENASKTILAKIFRKKTVGVIKFYTYVHLTSWKPTNSTHPLLLGQYENSMEPMFDTPKNMYMPPRMHIERGHIHVVYPKRGFTRISPRPSEVAVHHIRPWRPKWDPTSFRTQIFRNVRAVRDKPTCNNFSSVRPVDIKGPYIEKIARIVQQVYTKLGI